MMHYYYIMSKRRVTPDFKTIVIERYFDKLFMQIKGHKHVPWLVERGTYTNRRVYKRSMSMPNYSYMEHIGRPSGIFLEKEDYWGWFNSLRTDIHYVDNFILVKQQE